MIDLTVGRCRIQISFWFVAVCAFMLLLNREAQITLFAILIHEGGHIAAMVALGRTPGQIAFHAFGIDIGEGSIGGYREDALISLAGPFSNLMTGLIALAFWKPFAYLSLLLGLFHLLPIMYLDGGRALYSLLCAKQTAKKAEKVILFLSVLILLPVGIGAFFILLDSKGNFSLLLLWIYLMGMLVLKSKNFL